MGFVELELQLAAQSFNDCTSCIATRSKQLEVNLPLLGAKQ